MNMITFSIIIYWCYIFIGGQDYQSDDYIEVIIPAGKEIARFYIGIIDDDSVEETETFRVTIFEPSLPHGAVLGSTFTAEVAITDRDGMLSKLCNMFIKFNDILHVLLDIGYGYM